MRSLRLATGLNSTTWTWPDLRAKQFLTIVPKILESTSESPCVVICAGANNVGLDTPAGIAHRLAQVADAIKSMRPSANIVFVGLLPRHVKSHRNDVHPDYLRACNVNIKIMCDKMSYGFVDVWYGVVGDRRCFAGDGVHLSRKGKLILQKGIFYVVTGRSKCFVSRQEN